MNRDAWLKELYDANYNRLYKLAAYRLQMYVGHVSDAPDVIQDVFLEAARKNIVNHPNPEGWLICTTENICKNYRKADQRRSNKQRKCEQAAVAKGVGHSMQLICAAEDETQASDVMMTIQQILPKDEYDLIRQYCFEGRPIREMAARMNMSESALRVRMHRIRKKLEKCLKDM